MTDIRAKIDIWKELVAAGEYLSPQTGKILIAEVERLSAPAAPNVQETHRDFGEYDKPPRGRFQDMPVPTEADVAEIVERLRDNGYAPAGNAMPLRNQAADMLMRLSHPSAAGPSEDEVKAAQMVTQRYRKQISDTPELLSLLYDIDLLPEQIRLYANAVRMAAFCQLYAHTSPSAAGAEDSPPVNALIAKELGWRIWKDPRPEGNGGWFQERDGKPGMIEAMHVPDYIETLRTLPAPPVAAGEEG